MLYLESRHRIYGSHYLKDQGGKCQNLHGHQYEVVLSLEAPYESLDDKNMIIDTYEIETIFNRFIGSDHLHLNDFMGTENPTMEFMSKFFYDGLKKEIDQLESVTVFETPEASVTYIED